jgi:hypothetical protein
MRPIALTLILAALTLSACADTTSTTTPSSAASAHASSASDPARTPPATRTANASSERAALTVAAFARGYAAYLDSRGGLQQVPDSTVAVRRALGPQVPPATARASTLTVETISPQPAGRGSYLITFADRHRRFLSSATVARSAGRMLVVAVVPPDLDTVLSRSPTPRPLHLSQPRRSLPPAAS